MLKGNHYLPTRLGQVQIEDSKALIRWKKTNAINVVQNRICSCQSTQFNLMKGLKYTKTYLKLDMSLKLMLSCSFCFVKNMTLGLTQASVSTWSANLLRILQINAPTAVKPSAAASHMAIRRAICRDWKGDWIVLRSNQESTKSCLL